MKPYFIGVCGRSCSGKSTIASELERITPNSLHIKQDKFFKRNDDGYIYDWESPDSLRNDKLIGSIKDLKNRKSTYIPSHTWTEVFDRKVQPTDYIIVEGFLLFAIDQLYPLFDKRIWIDVTDENIINRRLQRGSQMNDYHYITTCVIPKSKQYEKLQRSRAHVIIDGNRNIEEVLKDFKESIRWY
jgi:uridine kinase